MTATAHRTLFRKSFGVALLTLAALILGAIGCSSTNNGSEGNNQNTGNGNTGNTGNTGANGQVSYSYVQEHWIGKSSDPEYPKTKFLTGLGVARGLEEADRKGVDAIAATFEIEVVSQIKTYESQIIEFSGNKPGNVSSETFSEAAFEARVGKVMEGAKAEKRYTHTDGQHFSFVVMDRKVFADNTKSRIDAQVEELKNLYKQAQASRQAGRWLGAMRRFSELVPIYRAIVRLIVQYNIGKPAGYPTITLEGLLRGLDLDLDAILEGLREAALQLKFAFRFDVQIVMKNGQKSAGKASEVESAIIKTYRNNNIEVFVHQSNARFANSPIDELRGMTAEQLGQLLGTDKVNYLVIGTLTTEYVEPKTMNGKTLHIVRCKYDIQVWNVPAQEMVPIASGYGSLGGKEKESDAHSDAVARAASKIANEILDHFGGGSE